jgi:hypothetical protein
MKEKPKVMTSGYAESESRRLKLKAGNHRKRFLLMRMEISPANSPFFFSGTS